MRTMTAAQVKRVTAKGFYRVAETLYINVKESGRKHWIQRVTVEGRRRDLGLGPYPLVDTLTAQQKAIENLRKIYENQPIELNEKRRRVTFSQAAAESLEIRRGGWKNGKEAKAWFARLENYAMPRLGNLPVASITGKDIEGVLKSIWEKQNPTARLVKQGIFDVLGYSKAKDYVTVNVADGIEKAMPKIKRKQENFASIPFEKVPAALQAIRGINSKPVKACLEFIMHTACRQNEARGATWSEIDFAKKLWQIPAERMKNNRPHTVPLSLQVMKMLSTINVDSSPKATLIFPSKQGIHKIQSPSTIRRGLEAAGLETTVHGFRASFSTWANEMGYDYRQVEIALAHAVGSQVEQVYNKAEFVSQRREMMQVWSNYLEETT